METPPTDHHVAQIVRRLLEKRGWPLIGIGEQDLIAATRHDLDADLADERAIEKCAARQYVIAFYQACRADGTPAQAQAFQYLGERLTRIALCKTGDEDWATDCAQRALKIIYEKLSTCDPRCFFSWTRQIVLNEFYQDLRQMHRHAEEPLDGDSDLAHYRPYAEEADVEQSTSETPEDLIADAETAVAVEQLVRRVNQVLGNSRHWQVVAEFYLNGRSYSEIAHKLQTTTGNVYLIMHRAIQKLRSNHRLMQELQGYLE